MARGQGMHICFLPSSLFTAFCSPELKPRASAYRKLGLSTVNIIKTNFSRVVRGPTWSNLSLLGYLSLRDLPGGAVVTVKMHHHAHLIDSWGTDLLREAWFGKDGPGCMWFAVENVSTLIFSSPLVNNPGWSPDNGKAGGQSEFLPVGGWLFCSKGSLVLWGSDLSDVSDLNFWALEVDYPSKLSGK